MLFGSHVRILSWPLQIRTLGNGVFCFLLLRGSALLTVSPSSLPSSQSTQHGNDSLPAVWASNRYLTFEGQSGQVQ